MKLVKPRENTNIVIYCSQCGKISDYNKAVDSGWIGIDEKPYTYLCNDCEKEVENEKM